jgi:hypothetical protein
MLPSPRGYPDENGTPPPPDAQLFNDALNANHSPPPQLLESAPPENDVVTQAFSHMAARITGANVYTAGERAISMLDTRFHTPSHQLTSVPGFSLEYPELIRNSKQYLESIISALRKKRPHRLEQDIILYAVQERNPAVGSAANTLNLTPSDDDFLKLFPSYDIAERYIGASDDLPTAKDIFAVKVFAGATLDGFNLDTTISHNLKNDQMMQVSEEHLALIHVDKRRELTELGQLHLDMLSQENLNMHYIWDK